MALSMLRGCFAPVSSTVTPDVDASCHELAECRSVMQAAL
jgi:hypothetical protein